MEVVYALGIIATIVYMTVTEKNRFNGFMLGSIVGWFWPVLILIYLYAVVFKKGERK